MKKAVSILLAVVMLFGLTACSNNNNNENEKKDLLTLMETVLGDADDNYSSILTEEVSSENFKSLLYFDYIEGAKAVVSAPMMSSIAHIVALIELPEGTDVQKVADEIEENMDPRKWVCVEAEKTAVVSSGNYILMVMSAEEVTDAVVKNFEENF